MTTTYTWRDTARRLVACPQWSTSAWIRQGWIPAVVWDEDGRTHLPDLTSPTSVGVMLETLKYAHAGSHPKLSLEYDDGEWCCWVSWTSDPSNVRDESRELYAKHAAEAVALALLEIWGSPTATER